MIEKEKASLDEMVDKIISKHEKKPLIQEDEIKTPAFRYLTDEEEITKEIYEDERAYVSMKLPDSTSLLAKTWEKQYVMGDCKTIEAIVQRHENINKNKN